MRFPALAKLACHGPEPQAQAASSYHYHSQHPQPHPPSQDRQSNDSLGAFNFSLANRLRSNNNDDDNNNYHDNYRNNNKTKSYEVVGMQPDRRGSNGLDIVFAGAAAHAKAGVLILPDDSSDEEDDVVDDKVVDDDKHQAPNLLSTKTITAMPRRPSYLQTNSTRPFLNGPRIGVRCNNSVNDNDIDIRHDNRHYDSSFKEKRKVTSTIAPYDETRNNRRREQYDPYHSLYGQPSHVAPPSFDTSYHHHYNYLHHHPFWLPPSPSSQPPPTLQHPYQHHHHAHASSRYFSYEILGHASLQLYKVQLPTCFFPLLEDIVRASEEYAQTLPHGWCTKLYSLTQQDVPLPHIPQLRNHIPPLYNYLRDCMEFLYPPPPRRCCDHDDSPTTSRSVQRQQRIVMDDHQSHILKYSVQDHHVGVELHHDKCDITCNLMLSSTADYTGGGTWFQALGKTVVLNFGEFLLHPGSLLHAGMDITSGSRYLMILFANQLDEQKK